MRDRLKVQSRRREADAMCQKRLELEEEMGAAPAAMVA
jgi:hypothetical protein